MPKNDKIQEGVPSPEMRSGEPPPPEGPPAKDVMAPTGWTSREEQARRGVAFWHPLGIEEAHHEGWTGARHDETIPGGRYKTRDGRWVNAFNQLIDPANGKVLDPVCLPRDT